MKGLWKFFFGGLIGAMFGFLVSPKRGQRVRDALMSKDHYTSEVTTEVVAPIGLAAPPAPFEPAVVSVPERPAEPYATGAQGVAEAAREDAAAAAIYQPEPELAPEPEPELEPELAPGPELAPEPETEPEMEPEPAPEPIAEVEPVEAEMESAAWIAPTLVAASPVEAEVEAEPVSAEAPIGVFEEAAATVWETPSVEEVVAPEYLAVGEASVDEGLAAPEEGPSVVVAPEILEEPILGPGWTQAAPELPSQYVEESVEEVAAGVDGSADLKSRIEETRRRIQRELDHPFGGDDRDQALLEHEEAEIAPSPFDVPSEVFASEAGLTPPELTSVVKEGTFSPSVPHFEPELESPYEEPTFPVQMTPWEEQSLSGEPESIPAAAFDVPAMSEAAEALGAPLAEEATFGEPPAISEPATPWDIPTPAAEVPPVEFPAAETPAAAAPAAEVPVAGAWEQPVPGPAPVPPEAGEPLTEEVDRLIRDEVAHEAAGPPIGSVAGPGEFDHEAMRRRIEETRNRLKAKAFDAMMSGETALLGRDTEEAKRVATQTQVQVDTEVSETIESTLTEEDF